MIVISDVGADAVTQEIGSQLPSWFDMLTTTVLAECKLKT